MEIVARLFAARFGKKRLAHNGIAPLGDFGAETANA